MRIERNFSKQSPRRVRGMETMKSPQKKIELVGGQFDGCCALAPQAGTAVVIEGSKYSHRATDGKWHYNPAPAGVDVCQFTGQLSAEEINVALANAILAKESGEGKFKAAHIEVTFITRPAGMPNAGAVDGCTVLCEIERP